MLALSSADNSTGLAEAVSDLTKTYYQSLSLTLPAWTCASPGQKRNPKRWGDHPLTYYLPAGVNLEDYSEAKAFLNTGFDIHAEGVFEDCSLGRGPRRS